MLSPTFGNNTPTIKGPGSNTRLLMTVYVGYSMMEVVSKSSPAEFSWNSKNLRALSVTAISATAAT